MGGVHPSSCGLRTGGLAWASLQHGSLEAVGLLTRQLRTFVQVFCWAGKTEAPPPFMTQPEKSQGFTSALFTSLSRFKRREHGPPFQWEESQVPL